MDRRLYCWIDGLYGWMITLLNVGISISIMKQLFIITQRHTDKKTEEEKMEVTSNRPKLRYVFTKV